MTHGVCDGLHPGTVMFVTDAICNGLWQVTCGICDGLCQVIGTREVCDGLCPVSQSFVAN